MSDLHPDEFMLVRIRDGAVIIPRLFLSKNGIGQTPVDAVRGGNHTLAHRVWTWLSADDRGHVSFGKHMAGVKTAAAIGKAMP